MKRHRLTRERQQQFLRSLADTGNVTLSVKLAGTSVGRVYTLRHSDPAFRQAWDEAEEIAADRLEAEAWRRAVDGVDEPVVSAGKLVRDEAGNAVVVRRYSDMLLLALLRARRPQKFGRGLAAAAGGGHDAAPDVRARLLAKLAQLAQHIEAERAPLLEHDAEPAHVAIPPIGEDA